MSYECQRHLSAPNIHFLRQRHYVLDRDTVILDPIMCGLMSKYSFQSFNVSLNLQSLLQIDANFLIMDHHNSHATLPNWITKKNHTTKVSISLKMQTRNSPQPSTRFADSLNVLSRRRQILKKLSKGVIQISSIHHF